VSPLQRYSRDAPVKSMSGTKPTARAAEVGSAPPPALATIPSSYESIYASLLPPSASEILALANEALPKRPVPLHPTNTRQGTPSAGVTTPASVPPQTSGTTTTASQEGVGKMPLSLEAFRNTEEFQKQKAALRRALRDGSFFKPKSEDQAALFDEEGSASKQRKEVSLLPGGHTTVIAPESQSSPSEAERSLVVSPAASGSSSSRSNLVTLAINTLVLEHLRDHGYHYTAQVFAPESKTHPAGPHSLTQADILAILGIKPPTVLQDDTTPANAETSPSSCLTKRLVPARSHRYIWQQLQKLEQERRLDGPRPPLAIEARDSTVKAGSQPEQRGKTSSLRRKSLLEIFCEAIADAATGGLAAMASNDETPGTHSESSDLSQKIMCDAATSTSDLELVIPRDSLQRKLQALDEAARARLERVEAMDAGGESFEVRLMRVQREAETRARKEMEERLRVFEAKRVEEIRREIGASYRVELAAQRAELERECEKRIRESQKRAQEAEERARTAEHELERVRYDARQELLSEVQAMRRREDEIRATLASERALVQSELKRLERELEAAMTTKAEAEKRLKDITSKEQTIDSILRSEVEARTLELNSRTNKAESRAESLTTALKQQSGELESLRQELSSLQTALAGVSEQQKAALKRAIEAEGTKFQLEAELADVKAQLRPLKERFEQELRRAVDSAAGVASAETLKELAKARAEVVTAAAAARVEVRNALEEELSKLRSQLHEARSRASQAVASQRTYEARLKEVEQSRDSLLSQLEQEVAERRHCEREIHRLERELSSLRAQLETSMSTPSASFGQGRSQIILNAPLSDTLGRAYPPVASKPDLGTSTVEVPIVPSGPSLQRALDSRSASTPAVDIEKLFPEIEEETAQLLKQLSQPVPRVSTSTTSASTHKRSAPRHERGPLQLEDESLDSVRSIYFDDSSHFSSRLAEEADGQGITPDEADEGKNSEPGSGGGVTMPSEAPSGVRKQFTPSNHPAAVMTAKPDGKVAPQQATRRPVMGARQQLSTTSRVNSSLSEVLQTFSGFEEDENELHSCVQGVLSSFHDTKLRLKNAIERPLVVEQAHTPTIQEHHHHHYHVTPMQPEQSSLVQTNATTKPQAEPVPIPVAVQASTVEPSLAKRESQGLSGPHTTAVTRTQVPSEQQAVAEQSRRSSMETRPPGQLHPVTTAVINSGTRPNEQVAESSQPLAASTASRPNDVTNTPATTVGTTPTMAVQHPVAPSTTLASPVLFVGASPLANDTIHIEDSDDIIIED